MSTLNSQFFTQTEPAVFQLLENCANGVPSEVASHFALGQSGENIRVLQQALSMISERMPTLDVMPVTVTGVYDAAFASAVAHYKRSRSILNYAGAIDNIVGRKTIASLDRDLIALQGDPAPEPCPPSPGPGPQPAPVGPCVPEGECPSAQKFTLQLLAGLTGGEVLEIGAFLFDVHDVTNNLSARYIGKVVGVGVPTPIPGSPSVLGSPTAFTTNSPCRVTDFFAFAIGSLALSFPYPLSASPVTLTHKGRDGIGQTMPFFLDSGPVSLPGAAVHAGSLELQTTCNGQRGARRGA